MKNSSTSDPKKLICLTNDKNFKYKLADSDFTYIIIIKVE